MPLKKTVQVRNNWPLLVLYVVLILGNLYVSEFSVTTFFTELLHIFIEGPAEARLRVRDFLDVLNTHWCP